MVTLRMHNDCTACQAQGDEGSYAVLTVLLMLKTTSCLDLITRDLCFVHRKHLREAEISLLKENP